MRIGLCVTEQERQPIQNKVAQHGTHITGVYHRKMEQLGIHNMNASLQDGDYRLHRQGDCAEQKNSPPMSTEPWLPA